MASDEQTRRQRAFNRFMTAANEARKNGYPINPLAAAAQACHETGFGKSTPPGSNNVLGIKAGRSWQGPTVNARTHEFYGGQRDDNVMGNWRVYQNLQECFEDYGRIIASLWFYKDAHAHADGDPFDYLTALQPIYGPDGVEVKEPGYFTDPNYVVNVMKLVRQYAPAVSSPSGRLLVVRVPKGDSHVQHTFDIPDGYVVMQQVNFDRDRHYVEIRRGDT